MVSSYVHSFSQELQNKLRNWVNEPSIKLESSFIKPIADTAITSLLTKFVGQAIPFSTRNGFKVIDVSRGYVKALIPIKKNKNHFNAMYAGALFTVAELPGGIITLLSFDERFYPILVDLKMEFIKMAKSDVTVEFRLSEKELKRIERETLAKDKSEFLLEGEIKDLEGNIVARSKASYQVRLR